MCRLISPSIQANWARVGRASGPFKLAESRSALSITHYPTRTPLAANSAQRPYDLPPVVAMPWMNVFCAKKNSTMIGIVNKVEPAIRSVHWLPFFAINCCSP